MSNRVVAFVTIPSLRLHALAFSCIPSHRFYPPRNSNMFRLRRTSFEKYNGHSRMTTQIALHWKALSEREQRNKRIRWVQSIKPLHGERKSATIWRVSDLHPLRPRQGSRCRALTEGHREAAARRPRGGSLSRVRGILSQIYLSILFVLPSYTYWMVSISGDHKLSSGAYMVYFCANSG